MYSNVQQVRKLIEYSKKKLTEVMTRKSNLIFRLRQTTTTNCTTRLFLLRHVLQYTKSNMYIPTHRTVQAQRCIYVGHGKFS